MPADTKLYLYLDPARLISDAPWTFDARQFAGWVPHQVIAYLWPQGPWFWVGENVGLPDWVTHRLWLGTLFLAAGKRRAVGSPGSSVSDSPLPSPRRSSTNWPRTSCRTSRGRRRCSSRGRGSAGSSG